MAQDARRLDLLCIKVCGRQAEVVEGRERGKRKRFLGIGDGDSFGGCGGADGDLGKTGLMTRWTQWEKSQREEEEFHKPRGWAADGNIMSDEAPWPDGKERRGGARARARGWHGMGMGPGNQKHQRSIRDLPPEVE